MLFTLSESMLILFISGQIMVMEDKESVIFVAAPIPSAPAYAFNEGVTHQSHKLADAYLPGACYAED